MNQSTEEGSTKIHIRYRDGRAFARRTRLIRDEYVLRTKKIREEAIEKLKALAEEAQKRATSKNLKTEERLDLVHMHRFKKGTSIASVIGYAKILTERWSRIIATYIDKTKHGDYVVSDFQEASVARPTGINFTQDTKQEMAQIL